MLDLQNYTIKAKRLITYLTTKFGRVVTLYQKQRGCTKFTVQPHTEVTGGPDKSGDL